METFIANLQRMINYPGMYFPLGELSEAMSMIAGMDLMQEQAFSNGFREWILREKIKTRSSLYWPALVKMHMELARVDKEEQLNEFFRLITEYYGDENIKLSNKKTKGHI